MIGWKPPAKIAKPYRRKTPQQMAADRAQVRKEIKTYMSKAEHHDVENIWCADYFLQRRRELGESSIQVVFSVNCFARLRPDIEL